MSKPYEEFEHYERTVMLPKGSGMTREQLTGAAMYSEWLQQQGYPLVAVKDLLQYAQAEEDFEKICSDGGGCAEFRKKWNVPKEYGPGRGCKKTLADWFSERRRAAIAKAEGK